MAGSAQKTPAQRPAAFGHLGDVQQRVGDLLRRLSRPGHLAERERQIVGADVDPIEARRVDDRLHVGQRLGRLDHGQREDRVVGVGQVVGAAVEQAPGRTEAARAGGRIPTGPDEGRRLLGVVNSGADDAVRTRIQELADRGRVVRGASGQGDSRSGAHGLQQRDGPVESVHAVLQIDGDGVVAAVRLHLGQVRAVDRHPAGDRRGPSGQQVTEPIRSHGLLLQLGRAAS